MLYVRRVAYALSLVLVCSTLSAAQETRGSIEGLIKDTTGGALPGVTVEARSPSLVGAQTTVTDAVGAYRFPALAPGVYVLTVTLQGFTPAKQERVVLELGQILKINFSLTPGSVTETVNVVAVSPVIDVKQNAAAATVEAELIDRIPKGRDFTTLVAFQAPGAQSESRNGGLQFDGSSGSENRFYVDGMDRTNLRTGLGGATATNTGGNPELLTDFVQQMVVKTSGYNAEHRAATGGTVSVLTKSGSNQWHGSAGTYFNSNDLQGQERPSIRLNPRDQTKAEYITTPPDDYTLLEPALELGGPLLHDRLWFYAGYVPRIRHDARTATFTTNNQTGVFRDDTTDHNGNYNVTAQLTKALRTKFAVSNERFRDGTDSRPTLEPDGTSNSNPDLFPSPLKRDTFDDSYTSVIDYVASNKLYVNLTAGYWSYGTRGSGAGSTIRHTFNGSNFQFPEIPANLRNVNSFSDALSNSSTLYDDYGRLGVNTEGTYYTSWKGQHALKAGLQFERLSNRVLDGAVAPNVTMFWDASRATLDGRRVRGTYGYYTVTQNRSEGDIAYNNVGLFLQDSWTLHNRVTLNLGVRTDRQDIPSYNPDNPGIHFGFGQMISPRLGFAWDMTGDSRWKMYGGWGNYFDIAKLEFPRGLFGAQKQITYYHTMDTFNWPSIQCGFPPVPGPTCPGSYIEQVDFRHPANARDNPLVDPNLKPVQAQEYSIGIDHELSARMSLGVRYVHKWMFRTFEDTGVQVPNVGEVFRITNPGEGLGENVLRDFAGCASCPNQPKPQRDYDALELRLKRRLANHWAFTTSYTLSRLYGNYSGLASSDEAGRTSPNVNRFFDGQYNSFDMQGRPVFGRLGTDRPHSWKGDTSYDFKWGTSIGMQYILESGTPLQTQMSEKNIPFYPFGRGDLGRTPVYHQANLLVQQDVRLPGGRRVNVNMNVLNLFDQDTPTAYQLTPYRDSFNITDAQFFGGFDAVALARATSSIRPDPRFNQASSFQTRRSIQLNARYTF